MKRLKYRGDKTETIAHGDILGPDADGIYHEVTNVLFDQGDGVTVVETRHHAPNWELTAPGAEPPRKRIRYYGGRGNPPPPEHKPAAADNIEAR
jgi:hypothetical protein